MLIRVAVASDADAVFVLAAGMATSLRVERSAFSRTFPAVLDRILVAVVGGRVVGYLLGSAHPTFHANGPVGWVEEIAVSSDERRMGVGRALMVAFEEVAREAGCGVVALATRRAGAFYEALGYAPDAEYFRKTL